MNAFIEMSPEEQRLVCEQTQDRLSLPAASVEKDFWVCWTLRELFNLPDWGAHLTFKGGTSLSKGWKLIERFSEDIDIVVDRGFLGYGGEKSPEAAPSKKQRRARLEELKAECQRRIHVGLKPLLESRIASTLPSGAKWRLSLASADEDPDQQTLLFEYPTVMHGASVYIRPVVKIEMGARSDIEPASAPTILPYIAEAFPGTLGPADFVVRVLAPERTFWEKAMLLHEETYRPAGKARKMRMARHYYDLWCLITKGVGARAVANEGLFARTAAHREIFFNWSWMDYNTLRRGSLRIVPMADQLDEWRRDYEGMQGAMFFGEVPSFEEVLRVVNEFASSFNCGTNDKA
jgi:hypothetical protein